MTKVVTSRERFNFPKHQAKFLAETKFFLFFFFIFFFRENVTFSCELYALADDSYEMSNLFFLKKKKKKLSSAAVMIGYLRVNL